MSGEPNVVGLNDARQKRHLQLEEAARQAFIEQKFDDALPLARQAIRYWPGCYRSHVLLGDVLCALQHEVEALKAYHRARRLGPGKAEALWSISTVHFLANRWSSALRYLRLARQALKRGDGPLYEWIAEDEATALVELGRKREAREILRWGLRRRPRSNRLRQLQARLDDHPPRLRVVGQRPAK